MPSKSPELETLTSEETAPAETSNELNEEPLNDTETPAETPEKSEAEKKSE